MDVQRLQTFRDVAELGSLAAAARATRQDPSAVSRSLAALEAELGVRLFQRSTRRLTLTEAGETYLARVRPLLEELAAAHEAASGLVERPRGCLRVTTSNAYGQTVLAALLPSFHAAYPEIELELVCADETLDLVAQRIDVAIRLGPRPVGDVVVSRLQSTNKRLVASPDYLAARDPIRRPEDVGGHTCLRFLLEGYRDHWLFRDTGGQELVVPVHGSLATANAMVLHQMALAGLGVTLLSDWMADDDIAAGRLIALLPDWTVAAGHFDTAIWLLYPSRRFLPHKARVFIDHLRERLA